MCDELKKYLENAIRKIQEIIGGDHLTGMYLTGSAAFNDLTDKSDMDIIVISAGPLPVKQKELLAEALKYEALPCPLAELDLIAVQESAVRNLTCEPEYEFAVRTGEKWQSEILFGGREAELLLEFEICRRHGKRLAGKRAEEVFAAVPRGQLLPVLQDILKEHGKNVHDSFHDPYGHYAVLNACRAWHFSKKNEFCSKTEGGILALGHCPDHPLIKQALAIRTGKSKVKLVRHQVTAFLKKMRKLIS